MVWDLSLVIGLEKQNLKMANSCLAIHFLTMISYHYCRVCCFNMHQLPINSFVEGLAASNVGFKTYSEQQTNNTATVSSYNKALQQSFFR
jgi:hypothetical protein